MGIYSLLKEFNSKVNPLEVQLLTENSLWNINVIGALTILVTIREWVG